MAASTFSKFLLCFALSCSAFSQTPPQTTDTNSSADQAPSPLNNDKATFPKLIHSEEPYFYEADRRRIRWVKATTIILITVDTSGRVKDAHVIKSSLETMKSKDADAATIIDQRCLDAVNHYRFEPATLDGKPVSVKLPVKIDVRMR